jgi:hypothetical protein
MSKARAMLSCPYCGAILERMKKADRIKQKRGPGSRIEKNIARCPECSRIIRLNGTPPPSRWRQALLFGAGAIAFLAMVGLGILVWLLRP